MLKDYVLWDSLSSGGTWLEWERESEVSTVNLVVVEALLLPRCVIDS